MPRGPNGERRPGDVVGCAVTVAKIATGELEDELPSARRNGGLVGGQSRSEALTAEERSVIAKNAALTRWGQNSTTTD